MCEYNAEYCIELLRNTYEALEAENAGRYPQKKDFSQEAVVAIKTYLGPWPRALEAAGIKPVDERKAELKLERRIRSKLRKTKAKIKSTGESGAERG